MTTKILLFTAIVAALIGAGLFLSTQEMTRHVTLRAQAWNDGKVHVWQSIVEAEATFVDLPDGTRCERLDDLTHKLIGPPPPIYYYHVDCDGVMGYVEVDQVR